MTIRTTRKSVEFTAPFRLPGFEEPLPAGSYQVETDEEMLEGNNYTAFHRTATTLRIQKGSAIERHPIDPALLAAALDRDQKAALRKGALPDSSAEQVASASISSPAPARWVSLWVRNTPPDDRR